MSSCSSAQVESISYGLMLDELLAHSVPESTVEELAEHLHDFIILDAREESEYLVSHLSGAIHIGYDHFDKNSMRGISKDSPIIVYCSVGYRSEKIAEQLLDMGFSDIRNLYGGIFEWKNQGKQVTDKNGTTEKVHAFSKTWGVWLNKGEKVYD